MSRNSRIPKLTLCLLLVIVTAAVGVVVGYNQHSSQLKTDSLEVQISASDQLTSSDPTNVQLSTSVSNNTIPSRFLVDDSNDYTLNPPTTVAEESVIQESEVSSYMSSDDGITTVEGASDSPVTEPGMRIDTNDSDTPTNPLVYSSGTSLFNAESSYVTLSEIDETEARWGLIDFVATELTSAKEGSTVIICDPHGQEVTRYSLGDFSSISPSVGEPNEIVSLDPDSASGPVLVKVYDSFGRIVRTSTCDGTDDQVEINSAIDALAGEDGRVLLSPGVFYTSSPILTRENLILEGSGYDTLLYLTDESNCDVISSVGGPYNPVPNVTIRNMRIDGNKDNQFKISPPADEWRDGHGIYRTGGDSTYENLWIENILRRGIVGHGGSNTIIRNNVLRDCDEVGIALSEVIDGEISGNELYNCGSASRPVPVNDDKGRAITVYLGENNRIYQNYCEGGGYFRQIGGYHSSYIKVHDNVLLNGIYIGIGVDSQYAYISNNVIINPGENGIDTYDAEDNWIEGNFVSGAGGTPRDGFPQEYKGICVNANRTTVKSNVVEFAHKPGIYVGPDDNGSMIEGNIIRNCGQNGGWQAQGIYLHSYKDGVSIANTIIRGNTAYDDQSSPTQQHGIFLSAKPGLIRDIIIEDNDLTGNGTRGINSYSKNVRETIIMDNLI